MTLNYHRAFSHTVQDAVSDMEEIKHCSELQLERGPRTSSCGQNRTSARLSGLMIRGEKAFQKWGNSKENTYHTKLGELHGSHRDRADCNNT